MRLALLTSAALLAGCADDSTYDLEIDHGDFADASEKVWSSVGARVRVLHLSPDTPAVDVYVNGDFSAPVVADLDYKEGTAYLNVPQGEYTFDVTAAGDPNVVLSFSARLRNGFLYSAVATDTFADITPVALVDMKRGLSRMDVRVRVFHAAPWVGDVDIWSLDGTPTKLFDDVPFGAYGGLDLPSSRTGYTVGVDVDEDAVPDLTFAVPALKPGTYTAVYANNDTDGNVFLIAHLEDGTVVQIDPS